MQGSALFHGRQLRTFENTDIDPEAYLIKEDS
jgi:hypothetical protein